MAPQEDRKRPAALNLAPVSSSSSDSSSTDSLKQPRTPRFAEATAIHSPVDQRKGPFSETVSQVPQAQPGDVGFGYIGGNSNRESVTMPMTPRSPLKSALKVPGTPGRRFDNPMSPTFRQEDVLEKREMMTEKEQARDVKLKMKVRLAKFALRGVGLSCSLIIIAMVSASFSVFISTKNLATLSSLPPWSTSTQLWPQIITLTAACISLAACIAVFIGYCKGGHARAEKVGVYYTLFACGYFIFSMLMWAGVAGALQFTRNNSDNQDLWGWACVDNTRADLFQDQVDYALVCRLQNWSLICIIIEILVDVVSVVLYSIVFYRYYTKRRLAKSMDARDRARSDLYLAQLRVQSAPNTPGFGPKSPGFSLKSPGLGGFYGPKSPSLSTYAMSPRFPPSQYRSLGDIAEQPSFTPGAPMAEPASSFAASSPKSPDKPFVLQAPPIKAPSATPKVGQGGFSGRSPTAGPGQGPAPFGNVENHAPVAQGEQQYAAVPIPGAYQEHTAPAPVAPGEQQYAAVPIPGAYADQVQRPPAGQTGYGVAQ